MKIEGDSDISDTCSSYIELRDTFHTSSKKGNVQVILNSDGLLLRHVMATGTHKDHIVNICDIIGGRCVLVQRITNIGSGGTCWACTPSIAEKQRNSSEESEAAYLYIFAYVLKKNRRKNIRRERTVITLRFRSYDTHFDNMQEAEKWCCALKSIRHNYILFCRIPCFDPCRNIQKSCERKRLLILLNPKSGSGKARNVFHNQVVNILNEADTAYDLYVTKYSNYAFNFVRQKNISSWNGIVAIGGDGLFHEIINGLLQRKDRKRTVNNVALGIIPCGSGNGLARSIAHHFREPYNPKPILSAALSVVSGKTSLMDIVEIEQYNKVTYSFLSIGWGLISDIDIESERFRSLGYQRFTFWTLHRLINLRTYRGRISYLLKSNCEQQNTPQSTNKTNFHHSKGSNTFSKSYVLKQNKISDIDKEFDDIISLETLANKSYHSRCNSLISSSSRLSTYYSIAESIYHSISSNSDSCETEMLDTDMTRSCLNSQLSQFEFNTLPSLRDPLPDTWLVEDGEFVMVHAVYQTHLGSDCFFSPQSMPNDGVMYLVMIRSGISRLQLLNFLINMSSGTHLPDNNNEFIDVKRVVAFRLEPQDNDGILTVDGEKIECGLLQAKLFPETVNIMVPNNRSFKDYV